LGREGSDDDRAHLQIIVDDLKNKQSILNTECGKQMDSLRNLLAARKKFEDDVAQCEKWLDEAQVATSMELRSPNVALLEEQLAKYNDLAKEAERVAADIEKCGDEGKSFMPSLSEPDKLTLQAYISNLQDKHKRLGGVIKDRSDAVKNNLDQFKAAAERVKQSADFMQRIQAEIKELNRPVSAKAEEVQNMLGSYEKILGDLKEYRAQLGDLPSSSLGELSSIVSQQDDLIKAIEDQIARLRQLLLLRQQFMALIQQITTFIAKYGEIVQEIEKGGHSVQDKIKKYDDVILKIQECEAVLAAATDKGQQIAADGSAADRNSVTETLTSLKQQLQNLRRTVEKQREALERSAAAHAQISDALDALLDRGHALEVSVQSRPLLERHLESVQDELKKHKNLASDVDKLLSELKTIQETARQEVGLPGSLNEKLSAAATLLTTLPNELKDRAQYLEHNRTVREVYHDLRGKLDKWIADAEDRIQSGEDGINFERAYADLEEHKVSWGIDEVLDWF